MRESVAIIEPIESAKEAGLRYVNDLKPGIRRQRRGKGFCYLEVDGLPVRDKATLGRIRSIVIPPAWKDVWICPYANGHLQATGRDVRGRKQSRYHPAWRVVRDETKYARMVDFGRMLPTIRSQVDKDLDQRGLPREKVLATIVRLLETTSIRVGNEEYARTNHSFGLTTMRGRHVKITGSKIAFTFEGKSGVRHAVDIRDGRLARVIRQCQDIPGYELFQYEDSDGRHTVDSADVNAYIRAASGQDFTAKDFRTWAGTVSACRLFRQQEPFTSDMEAKKSVVAVIKLVANALGNTPSVCRKCYVHPAVTETYLNGEMNIHFKNQRRLKNLDKSCRALQREERDLLGLLSRQLAKRTQSEGARETANLSGDN